MRPILARAERSLLQHDLSVSNLPLPPVAEDAAPQGPSPDVERNNGSPVESISPVAPAYMPTANELNVQLLPAVQRGYDLAQRGALFAAQTEFVQVLRRVAQARDAASRSNEHSRALAAGLRASTRPKTLSRRASSSKQTLICKLCHHRTALQFSAITRRSC